MSEPRSETGPPASTGLGAGLLRLARSKAALTLAGQGVVSAGNFAASVLIGRSSQEELGLYVLGFTIVLFAINTQTALITTPYTVFSPRMRGRHLRRYSGSTLLHQMTLALTLMAGAALAGIAAGGGEGLPRVLLALSAVIGALLFKEYARQVSFARLHAGTALLLDMSVAAVQIGGLAWLAYLGGLTASRAFLAVGCGAAFAGLTWLAFRRASFSPSPRWAVQDLRRNWRFGKWLLAQNLAFAATNQLYPWMLAGFHGTEATGAFGACMAIIFFSNPFILGMSNFLGPKTVHAYVEGGIPGMRRVVRKATLFFTASMGLFCIVVFIAGGWAVETLYGPRYAGYGMTMSLLAVSQLAWAYTIPPNFGLNAMERPDVAFKSLLIALLITVTLGIWLVRAHGPSGVALGLLLGNLAATAFNRWMYAREARKRAALEVNE